MNTTTVHHQNGINWEHNKDQDSGTLYVRQDPDQAYIPRFAKPGDVGLDLPIKVQIDFIKFQTEGTQYEPDKMRTPQTYPAYAAYVKPNGTPEDPRPCVDIPPMGWAEIPSGFCVKIPDDAWGMVTNRSSTSWKHHLIVIPGTIDPGYTGQLATLVYNPTPNLIRVYEYDPDTGKGDRLAQMILIPRYDLKRIVLTDTLPHTPRGKTGFGSTTVRG
jgi:deoxyuridine 5'-triphosphate nucleotidohydrolase